MSEALLWIWSLLLPYALYWTRVDLFFSRKWLMWVLNTLVRSKMKLTLADLFVLSIWRCGQDGYKLMHLLATLAYQPIFYKIVKLVLDG